MADPTQVLVADPGSAAPAADPNASPQAAVPAVPADMVMIPRSTFDGLDGINPADHHNLRAMLKRQAEMRRNGWTGFIESAEQNGKWNGHTLGGQLARRNWGLEDPAPQPEPAPDPSAQAGYVPPYDQNAFVYTDPAQGLQPQTYTREEVDRMIAEKFQAADEKFQATLKERDETAEKARDRRDATIASYEARTEALKGLGFERKATKQDYLGKEAERDALYDGTIVPILTQAADDLFERDVHPNDERRDEKLNGPIPPEYWQRAAEQLKPQLALFQQTAAQVEADRQQSLPHGAVPAGAGGRPQKPVADMDPDEQEQEVIRRRKAKGATFEE